MAQATPPADDAKPAAKKPAAAKPAAAKTTAAKPAAAKTTAAKPAAAKPAAAKAPAAKPTAAKAAPAKTTAAKAPAAVQAAAAAPAADVVPPAPAVAAAPAPAAASVPPVPPASAGIPTAYAAEPAAPRKRPIWPWFVGGGVLLLILLIVGVSVLVGTLLGAVGNSTNSPASTVLAFDQSFKTNDCKLFQSTTTKEFQDGYFEGGFDCDQWSDIAVSLHDNGVYHYTVVVNDTKVKGDGADVTTSEKDTTPGAEESYELDYHLVKQGGGWVIDGIQNLG